MVAELSQVGLLVAGRADQLRELLGQQAQFTPVMRFILAHAETRDFRAQRWCYRR